MTNQFVHAIYETREQAEKAVDRLTQANIPRTAISLYGPGDDLVKEKDLERDENADDLAIVGTTGTMQNIVPTIWQPYDALMSDSSLINLEGYQDDIDKGSIVLVISSDYEAESLKVDK